MVLAPSTAPPLAPKMPPMSGAATLVPPNFSQVELPNWLGPYTATPVAGSESAETSAMVRLRQPVSVCHHGLWKKRLQPLPAPCHTVSAQPRSLESRTKCVPPTEITVGKSAGACTP